VYCIVLSFVVCCTVVSFISNCHVACVLDLRNVTRMCVRNRWQKGGMLFVVSVGSGGKDVVNLVPWRSL